MKKSIAFLVILAFAVASTTISCKKKNADTEEDTEASVEWGFALKPDTFPWGLPMPALLSIKVGDPGWVAGGKATVFFPKSLYDVEIPDEYFDLFNKNVVKVAGTPELCRGEFAHSVVPSDVGFSIEITSSDGCDAGADVTVTYSSPDRASEGAHNIVLDLSGAVGEEGVKTEAALNVVKRVPSALDGKGSCVVSPSKVEAGVKVDLTIECVTEGIKPGGSVDIAIPHALYSTRPYTSVPGITEHERAAQVVAKSDSGAEFKSTSVQRVYHKTLDIKVTQEIAPGGKIIVTLPGCAFYVSGSWNLEVWTDADGDGAFELIPTKLPVSVSPGAFDFWSYSSTYYSPTDEMAGVRLMAGDLYGNPLGARKPASLMVKDTNFFAVANRDGAFSVDFQKKNPDFIMAELTLGSGKNDNLKAPIFPYDRKGIYKTYWGDLHGHAGYTDGHGSADDYFGFAKRTSALDFAALTDHQQWTDDAEWEEIQASAKRHTAPGKFVAFAGLEIANGSFEHTNIVFPGRATLTRPSGPLCGELFMFDLAGCVMNLFVYGAKDLEAVVSANNAIAFSHRAGTNGAFKNFLAPDKQPVVEIYSAHGSAEDHNSPNKIASLGDTDQTIEDLIASGKRLGFVANGDSHDGRPGYTMWGEKSGGITAVIAADLKPESIFEALRSRRTYATTGKKIPLTFKIDSHLMGEEFSTSGYIRVSAASMGSLEVRRFYNGQWLSYHQPCDFDYCAQALELDLASAPGLNIFYLRVKSRNNVPIAWSSPIWVNVQ